MNFSRPSPIFDDEQLHHLPSVVCVNLRVGRRAIHTISSLIAIGVLWAITAAPALAQRSYDSQITGFAHPGAITIDSADHVWISDSANDGQISEYDAYPSQTLLAQQNGDGKFQFGGGYIAGLAVGPNGDLYVGEYDQINVFNASGTFIPPSWTGVAGFGGGFPIAIDSSAESSSGRLYVAAPISSEPYADGYVKAYEQNRNPVDFSASEPYISGNKITGTPEYEFQYAFNGKPHQGPDGITVDPNGNIYVVEPVHSEVDEYEPSGAFLRAFTGVEVSGGFGELTGVAVDPTTENVLIVDSEKDVVDEFSSTGTYLGQITGTSPSQPFNELSGGISVNSEGYVYVADRLHGTVDIFTPDRHLPKITYGEVTNLTPTSEKVTATVDPSIAGPITACYFEYGTTSSYGSPHIPCEPATPYTSPTEASANISGLVSETTYHYRIVLNTEEGTRKGADRVFRPNFVPNLTTEPASNLTNTSAVAHGSFIGNGEETTYYYQYGTDTSYGQTTEIHSAGSPTGPQTVAPVTISGLQPLVTYHFRIVASNSLGTTYGQDETFVTPSKPTIDSLSSTNITATTAELTAEINPQGGETTYYFEYGPDASYGTATPIQPEDIGEGRSDRSVSAALVGLQSGVTYHFRVVAENQYGSAASEDQTFGFYPPHCPNTHLRQITNSSYLPDCRAYELVSPADAGGTTLFPEGPNSAEETTPPRFAFGGLLSTIPGTGSPINDFGDLYVATRTDEGWITKYVGFPSDQALKDGAPPNEPTAAAVLNSPAGVRADSDMNEFLDWNDGDKSNSGPQPEYNFTPHAWSSDGNSLGEWPTAPGYSAQHSFEFNQSADFSHFVFQNGEPPALTLVDNNTDTNAAAPVSFQADGAPIEIQPGDTSPDAESLAVPAVSSDGSRIVMAARSVSQETCDIFGQSIKCPVRPPSILYMRVNDAVTYEVSEGHAVNYVGMTPDGSNVYFTSEEHLTHEDEDHAGSSLFMWSAEMEEKREPPLTLISKGETNDAPGNPGDTSSCDASWTTSCGIETYENNGFYNGTRTFTYGDLLGSGLSDNSIAAANGDIYFFSPEQLIGSSGIDGQENLYLYRDQRLQYVTTVSPQPYCETAERSWCSVGPIVRMQVSPTDSYMAFLTTSQVTSYNNHGYLEMYRYEPSTEQLICVSCRPNGQPPTTNVEASSNGLFMTNNGRTFFSTGDSLVPEDTDGLRDVYEYVEGHAQLISSGTSSKERVTGAGLAAGEYNDLFIAGLVGVSGNGTNVYFSTYDTLVGQDRNGSQLKFYDARTDGGFPYLSPAAPCEAADECHGAGSSPEASFQNGSDTELGANENVNSTPGGNNHHRNHRAHKHKRKANKHKTTARRKRRGVRIHRGRR